MKGGIPWLAIIPWRSLLSRRPLIFVSSMLYQIASFLLDVVGGLLTGACLLRLYMQWQRVPFSNPVGGLVFALTSTVVPAGDGALKFPLLTLGAMWVNPP